MNKKNIVTKENIEKVADFLKDSIEWLKANDMGCCHFNLSSDLALYIGWSDGWDENDESVIHSESEPSWAIDAAVKVRNDYDCADFEYLDFPCYADGEAWNNSVSMRPNQSRRDFKRDARWFLETFVSMTNELKSGRLQLSYDY